MAAAAGVVTVVEAAQEVVALVVQLGSMHFLKALGYVCI
jgi:hypothetical protein